MRPLLGVGFHVADDLVFALLVGVFVDQGDGGAELDAGARQFGNVDHIGAADLVFQFHHPAFDEALLLLGGVIFGILRQVAMGARFRDRLDDLVAVHILELVQSSSRPLKPAAVIGIFSMATIPSGKKRLCAAGILPVDAER